MTSTATILVVDDEQGMRQTLREILEEEGHRVAACGTAAEALQLIEERPPDIVVSALNLPDGSGLEILPALNRINSDAAFIVITGNASHETAMKALSEGVFAYHVKPLDTDALQFSIRHALRQQLLTKENTELLERLEQANKELRLARDTALEASQAELYFLATMSHEIRTPMNAIIGMAALLSESPLTPEQQEDVRVIRSAGDNLLEIINDILDLSKVEAGQLEPEEVDFDLLELVEEAAAFLAPRAHDKGLELNCRIAPDVPPSLVGDPIRLRRVLRNLIGSAIKFTLEGRVSLKIENCSGTDEIGFLLFRVSGIGIPAEKLDSVFESSTQVDCSRTRRYGETGLALTICRRLVEMMGGRIWGLSTAGGGCTFFFTARFETSAKSDLKTTLHEEELKELKDLQGEIGWEKRTPKSDKIERRRCQYERCPSRKIHEGIPPGSSEAGNGREAIIAGGSPPVVPGAIDVRVLGEGTKGRQTGRCRQDVQALD